MDDTILGILLGNLIYTWIAPWFDGDDEDDE